VECPDFGSSPMTIRDNSAQTAYSGYWAIYVLALGCILLICSVAACVPPTRSAQTIVRGYEMARCVPLSGNARVQPPTREWDSTLNLRSGIQIAIRGAKIPGGRVSVYYPSDRSTFIAADPSDYVYPTDIRIDDKNNLLLVKARGLAGGISEQTWLFEYDILRQKILGRVQVKNDVLPAECSGS
jgi:hypothetical protein